MRNFHSKKGVSLITVLLFMLVATIAATATYKWLSSEGSSSAARLRKSEAYQSSQAGLESVRSWMTYHAHDVGSLIKQYKDGGNKAIHLNPLLKEIIRPDQQYDVWLVGANTEKSTYKIKILSSGRSRNNSVYNQVAIFNVDGLYQVSRAKEKTLTKVDFDYAYFGGSYTGAGNVSMTSAVVNGNWKGNPQNVQNNFVITGNAELSGNNVNIGNLACVGGDLSIDNQGLTVKDLFVGGASRNSRITASGDVYFNGDVSQGQTGPIVIDGSVTLNGVMRTNQRSASDYVEIGKNLCVDEAKGKVVSGGTQSKFEVKGNVLMPGKQNIIAATSTESCQCEYYWEGMEDGTYVKKLQDGTRPCNGLSYPYSAGSVVSCSYNYSMFNNENSYDKIILGSSGDSKVYVKGVKESNRYNTEIAKAYSVSGKKYCPENTRFKIKDKNNWDRPTGQGHYTKHKTELNLNVCGTLSNETSYTATARKCEQTDWWGSCIRFSDKSFEAIDYTRGWQDWTSGNVQLFSQVSANTDKYLIFNESNVSFKNNKELTDWRQFNIPASGSPSQNGTKTPIWAQDWNIGFDDHFKSKVTIGAFVFGAGPDEKLYYNPTTNTNIFLNYENGTPTGSPYCYNDGTAEGKYRPTCGVTPWFKTNATGTNIKDRIGAAEKGQIKCAEDLVGRCEEFWGSPTTGCDNSKYKVPDMLVTGKQTFEKFADIGCASDIKQWGPGLANELNECYQENIRNEDKKNNNLYNGYLVVKVQGAQGTQNCPAGDFKGNYIILVDGAPIDCQNGLPTVQDGFRTFLYLNKGADNIGNKTTRNYFIYTRDDIKSAKQLNLYGTIYAEARTCAGMGDLQSSSLNYDPDLMSDMVSAGIICERGSETPEAAESTCGSETISGGGSGMTPPSGAGAGAGTTISIENKDAYYVSNAATLSISLESQYKSDEDLPSETNSITAAGDIVVVPRIIYMTRDPYGTLSDYYNVIGLNGLKVNKNNGSARCFGPSNLRTSGALYNRDGSDEKLAKGEYQCTYSYDNISVPFYVNVDGESGSTPFVSFSESNVDMGKSTSYDVKIVVPPHSTQLAVAITKPDNLTNWVITPNSSIGNCAGNTCTFTLQASSTRSEQTVFSVSTSGASNGTAVFTLSAGEGYAVGTPSSITLKYAATVNVSRYEATLDEISSFCSNNSNAGCPDDKNNWPDCTPGEAWVVASGDNCVTTETNSRWVCGSAGDISLISAAAVPGCITIIPQRVLQSSSFDAGDALELPATIKAKPMKFKFGFTGSDLNGKQILATVVGSSAANRVNSVSKVCTYGSDVHSSSELCEIDVFKGERLSLSFIGERPRNFNYWSCEGASCPSTPSSGVPLTGIVITNDGDKAYAHFDETDNHCFFDEFKDDGCETEYCFTSPKKWRLMSDDFATKVEYHYGHVSVRPNKKDKEGIIVLSRVVPGMNGTLKAQFQVPQISRNESSKVLTTIKNNGFILRSNANATDYLLLSLYANKDGYLTASLCTSNGSVCKEKRYNLRVSTSSVITLTANVSTSTMDLFASTSRLGNNVPYAISFSFVDDGFSNYASYGSNIGFRMTDPNFVLYDIGWKSDDYGAQCWDTYPTLNCSFRSAYLGGVVPQNEYVTPWVGLSSWFDDKNCEAAYFYKGGDACGASNFGYTQCTSSGYSFSDEGPHGYKDNSDNEIKTAKAGVLNCYNLTDNERALFDNERAHCGEFWVGKMNKCTESVELLSYPRTVYSGASESFNINSGFLNTREATLNIELENNDGSTVEIYLLSQQDHNTNPSYSRSFETTQSGKIAINVEDLLDAEGFDPEKVSGVTVSVLDGSNVTVKQVYTSCPYVVTLPSCEARFDNGLWHISAYATNYVDVSSFVITSDWTSVQNYTCSNDGICYEENKYSTTPSGNSATYSFNIEDNPYEHSGEKYQFTINMATHEGKTLTCTTNEVQISSIKATCGELGDENVRPGQGIPSFKYTMADCPNNNCPYRITLDGLEIVTGNGNIGNGKTSVSAANTTASPLAAGTYKFKLESNDPNLPFEACYSEEFTVGNGSSGGDGDETYNGTICLAGDWPEVSQGKGLTAPLTEGTYFVNQDCYTASDWGMAYFYICNGTVTLGDIELNCDGQEKQPTTTLDPSNHLLTIGKNSSLSKLGCFKSRASCNSGFTPGTSSGDDPETPSFDGEKLSCHIENEAGENLGTSAEINYGDKVYLVYNYIGSCFYATLAGNGVDNPYDNRCNNNRQAIVPSMGGLQTYSFDVSQGFIGDNVDPTASCEISINVNKTTIEDASSCNDENSIALEYGVTSKAISNACYSCKVSNNYLALENFGNGTNASVRKCDGTVSNVDVRQNTQVPNNGYWEYYNTGNCDVYFVLDNPVDIRCQGEWAPATPITSAADCNAENSTSLNHGGDYTSLNENACYSCNVSSGYLALENEGGTTNGSIKNCDGTTSNVEVRQNTQVPNNGYWEYYNTGSCDVYFVLDNPRKVRCQGEWAPATPITSAADCNAENSTSLNHGGDYTNLNENACYSCNVLSGYLALENGGETTNGSIKNCDGTTSNVEIRQNTQVPNNGYWEYYNTGSCNVYFVLDNPRNVRCQGEWAPTIEQGGDDPDDNSSSSESSSSSAESSSSSSEDSSSSSDNGGSGGGETRTLTYGSYQEFTAGQTYILEMDRGSVFRCRYSTSEAVIVGKLNDVTISAAVNSGGQATIQNPGQGQKATFVVDPSAPSDLECSNDW